MLPLQQWNLLAKQTDIGHSRTSALTPLQWTLAILLFGLVLLIWTKSYAWLIVGLAVCVFLAVGLVAAAYFYFMIKNPDALRSEGFHLQRMAIEKGILGDSLQGLKTIDASMTKDIVVANKSDKEQQEG